MEMAENTAKQQPMIESSYLDQKAMMAQWGLRVMPVMTEMDGHGIGMLFMDKNGVWFENKPYSVVWRKTWGEFYAGKDGALQG